MNWLCEFELEFGSFSKNKYEPQLRVDMASEKRNNESISVTEISVSGPKFQATVPQTTRQVLGIDDLDENEHAILEAQYKLKSIIEK